MKVENIQDTSELYCDIKSGEPFTFCGELYLKTDTIGKNNEIASVELKSGKLIKSFIHTDVVKRARVKVVNDYD